MSFYSFMASGSNASLNRATGPDFFDDFTSYADQSAFDSSWPTVNASLQGNPSTDLIYMRVYRHNVGASEDDYYMNKSLGFTASDTAWVFRWKTITSNVVADTLFDEVGIIGLTDSSFGSTSFLVTTHKYIGMKYAVFTGADYDQTLSSGNSTTIYSSSTSQVLNTRTAETAYMEMIRTSATTTSLEQFSDSDYTTSVSNTTSTCSSSVNSLTTIGLCNFNPGSEKTGRVDVDIHDITIYDGVTSV